MGNSLFDQLKKTGLVDEKKAKKVKQEKHQGKKQKRKKGQAILPGEATLLVQQAQTAKLEQDRRLNQERKEIAEHKAIVAQIKQLIESNRVIERDGERIYNFTDKNKIKHLYLNDTIHKQLCSGYLALAKLGESYELVPTVVAEKIKQRDPANVILCAPETQQKADENDPYADYKIPDDLMW
ncbi:Nucleoprotein/polynucleotide-associated enzyme [hydrothermal vent metagenome]|uniref:Nucleoprotein/polynucleotide-associated enzyme n=1 Tax=hydrothermal vent metagenome TaxID=652676 RepID=A0A3B0YT65_9ZZZZ